MEVMASEKMSQEKISMANLLNRFRIDADVFPVMLEMGGGQRLVPSDEIRELHAGLLPGGVELDARTERHLFMADRIRQISKSADLVVISIPMPEVKLDSLLYMSWLECMSRDMPPTILIRGNQESVLTWEL
jgi:hypothetical protein